MKRQRRQELKTNDLSVYLAKSGEFLQQNGTTVILVVIGVIVAAGGAAWWREGRATRAEESWNRYYEAAKVASTVKPDDPTAVEDAVTKWQQTIEESTDPQAEVQSKWALATMCLRQAVDSSKPEAKKGFLETAEQYCTEVRQSPIANTVQRAAAINCLITIEFDRFVLDGDLAHKERARKYLEILRDDGEYLGSPFQAEALDRLNSFEALWEPLVLEQPKPESPPATPEVAPTTPQAPAPAPGSPSGDQPKVPAGDPNEGAADTKPQDAAPSGQPGTPPEDNPQPKPDGGQ